MNIDDRLRKAHQDRLANTAHKTQLATYQPTSPSLAPRLAIVAVVVVAVAAVGWAATRPATGKVDVADTIPTTAVTTTNPRQESTDAAPEAPTTTLAASANASSQPQTTAGPPPESETTQAAASGSATTAVPEVPSTTEPPTTTEPATTDAPDQARSNPESSRCPSGFRAPLELGSVGYVGDDNGWGRVTDLVDEQDTQYTFQAWDPGYPNPITASVTLQGPVNATDFRVAQDPFTPVSGSIDITAMMEGAVVERFAIELEGVDGWKVHSFAVPTEVDGFTITRSAAESNIMEVMICTTAE